MESLILSLLGELRGQFIKSGFWFISFIGAFVGLLLFNEIEIAPTLFQEGILFNLLATISIFLIAVAGISTIFREIFGFQLVDKISAAINAVLLASAGSMLYFIAGLILVVVMHLLLDFDISGLLLLLSLLALIYLILVAVLIPNLLVNRVKPFDKPWAAFLMSFIASVALLWIFN